VSLRLALGALAIVVLAAGCGGDDDRRDAVAAYIDDANAIQRELRVPITGAARVYADFSSGDADLAEVRPRLARSRSLFRTLERRLARLQPPPDARRLHSLLLGLVGAQAEIAREIEGVAGFVPRFEQHRNPLRSAERRLRTALAASRSADADAAALNRYGRDVGAVLRGLAALQPPAVVAAAYQAQVETLAKVRREAAALAKAIRDGNVEVLPTRFRQLAGAARGSQSLAAQRSHIAAVKLYNRRISTLSRLERAVNRERSRLQRELG
jgi:hypothetical protein